MRDPTVDVWATWSCVLAVFGFQYIDGLAMTEEENTRSNLRRKFDGCVLHFSLSIYVKVVKCSDYILPVNVMSKRKVHLVASFGVFLC